MKPGSISTRILISFLIILLAAFSMPQPAEAQGTTQVYLNPASSTVTTCADLTIAVSVADVQDLYGYALRLTFTPGSLQVLNVVNGGFLSDGLMAPTNGWNNTTGEILFDMSMMGEPEGRDGSGDLIRITLRATTPGATVAFTIDPVYSQLVNWPAVMPIPFTITDGTVTTAGCAPTDISLSSSTVAENQPAGVLVGSFSSVDADTGETFTYSLQDDVSFPDNHYFQISGNQLLTLLPADYETDPSLLIRVRTTDSTGLYYEETLTITVTDINDAPVLDPIPNPSGGEETLITFTATASDQDGDALTFSLTDGTAGDVPAGASITAGGVFTWTPTEAQGPGTYTFDVCVGDGTETDCQTITVTVNEVNVAPVLNPVGDQTVHEGDTLTFTATATDADVPANTLTFSLAGTLPAGASITAGGVFTWTPTAEQAPGWYTFDVCVSDGALNDCETIDVTVTSDEPPVVYVDDGWAGTLPGVDPDGTGPATAFGYDAFALIQDGVNGVAPDGTVYVAAGTYFESDILIDQPMDLIGAGAGASIIGPAVADGHDCSPLGSNAHFGIIIGADGVTIQGFTIDGNQDGSLPGDYNYRMGITSRYWVATYDTSTVLDTVVQNIWYRGVVIRAYTGETSSDHRLDNVDVANIVNTCTDEQSFAILYFNAAGEIANSTATNAYQGIATGNYTGIPLVANIHHNVVTDITSQAYTLTHNDAGTVFANNTATFTNPANAGIGLLVYQANGFTVTNNTFTGAHTGVYVGRQVGDPSLFVIGAGNTLTGPGITVAGSVGVLADGTGWADENSNFTLEKSLITGYETGVRLDRLDTTGTTTAVVRSNNLLDNGTGIYLGTRSTLTAHHNRIFNNTVGYNNASGGAAVAENNWWGCNVGPNDTYGDCDTTVNVDYTPWLVLQGTAPTSETEFGAPPVTFTARLMRNSAGEDASSPTLGYVPDGIVVSFQTMDGIFTPPTSPLVNGVTTSQYTANNARASLLCAVLDNEWYGGGGCWTILINDAPIPGTNTFTTGEDTPLNGTLAATDDEGYALTYVVATPPAHGTVTINLDGTFTYTPATDWFGTDTFTFTVSDDIGGVTGTATITVTPVNDAPVAVDDTATTAEDTPVDILVSTLLANDTDIDGDTLSLTAVSNPSNGTVALAVGVVTFTPADNFHGEAGFDYTVSDGTLTDTGHVTITVTPVNDAPVADDQSLSTPEETALPVTLTATDVDGDPLSFEVTVQPLHGTLSGTAPSLTYTPALNYNGSDSFTFSVSDGHDGTDTGVISITVTPVNDAPVAVNDAYETDEDTLLTVAAPGVLSNDTDVDGDTLTAVLVADAAHGTLALAADGSFTYLPDTDFLGTDTFTYRASDGTLTSEIITVTITVHEVNDAPVALDDVYTTNEDTLLTVAAPGVLVNDTDTEGDPLTAVLVADAAHGTLALAADGSFTYQPDLDWHGTDTFTYQANDGLENSNIATVSITVTPVNDAPVADDQSLSTPEETSFPVTLTATDVDGDPLSFEVTVQPLHGTLSGTAPSLTYTPALNYNGSDSFTFSVSDGHGGTDTGVISITVTPVNDAPVAVNDAYETDEDTLLTVAAPGVLSNDTDVDGDPLTAVLVADAAHGTLALAADGSFTYQPDADWFGVDTFTYQAYDGEDYSEVVTVTITVHDVVDNTPPVAVADEYTMDEDTTLFVDAPGILENDTDPENDVLEAELVDDVSTGTLVLNSDGSFTYTPIKNYYGTVTFTYRAFDGEYYSEPVTVTITVNNVADAIWLVIILK